MMINDPNYRTFATDFIFSFFPLFGFPAHIPSGVPSLMMIDDTYHGTLAFRTDSRFHRCLVETHDD